MCNNTQEQCDKYIINTREICQIGGYYVTETKFPNNNGNTTSCFNIRNAEGEIIGDDFDIVLVPINILDQFDKYNKGLMV